MIQNPILRGFCPDPSIIRVGEDYYIATSTFEWWPGVKLFHSRNLKEWEQIPSPLRRMSQLNMLGDPTSGGVWAPCLSYDGDKYYLVYTDVKTKKGRFYNTHNYMVWTDDIYGGWSEPVYLNSIGFDPSLFHDTDGKKYLINMVNGFKGILVQELKPGKEGEPAWTLCGERRKVYTGSGIGCTEGPHMYHIGDWYYLMVAEGGTGYDHCVTLARSKSVWGPFETAPNNPIMTSDKSDRNALQKAGHADLTDTPGGEWYMVHLCSRPLKESEQGEQKWCTLGRETGIQKVRWNQDGWLEMADGGRYARGSVQEPEDSLAEADRIERGVGAAEEGREERENSTAWDVHKAQYPGSVMYIHEDFEDKELPVYFSSPRTSYDTFTDLGSRPGYLRMRGQESMNSLHHVSLLACRQQELAAEAETTLLFTPEYPEQLAGITLMYDAMNFYILGKTVTEDGVSVLTLVKSDTGIITDEITPIPVPSEGEIGLRVVISDDGSKVAFYYKVLKEGDTENNDQWILAGKDFTTEIVTDEHCRGFTGAHFGMYVHDMTGLGKCADFDYFDLHYRI